MNVWKLGKCKKKKRRYKLKKRKKNTKRTEAKKPQNSMLSLEYRAIRVKIREKVPPQARARAPDWRAGRRKSAEISEV